MKISVCMAVYNGAAYLEPQLRSILEQLRPQDEVVIVNDASRDHSAELLRTFPDARVRVYHNAGNLGVLASFEKALRLAQGDLIFLSDQDDLWLPGKVGKILDVFASDPGITLVASDAKVIDGDGKTVADSFFSHRGGFRPGILHNIMKNKYLGCTLAFRHSMLRYFLPVPPDVPMHDMWFGILNQIYGQTRYIAQPLIAYRRHSGNFSSLSGASVAQKLIWRWHLLKSVILRCMTFPAKNRNANDAI